MSIQATNINFQGRTKKTNRGNEFRATCMARNTGCGVGLLSGALVSHMAVKSLKTPEGEQDFLNSLKNMNLSLKALGKTPEEIKRNKTLGVAAVATVIALGLATFGAFIGNIIDKNTNKQRAKAADEAAMANR